VERIVVVERRRSGKYSLFALIHGESPSEPRDERGAARAREMPVAKVPAVEGNSSIGVFRHFEIALNPASGRELAPGVDGLLLCLCEEDDVGAGFQPTRLTLWPAELFPCACSKRLLVTNPVTPQDVNPAPIGKTMWRCAPVPYSHSYEACDIGRSAGVRDQTDDFLPLNDCPHRVIAARARMTAPIAGKRIGSFHLLKKL